MVAEGKYREKCNGGKRIKSGRRRKKVKERSIMFQKLFTLNLNESFFGAFLWKGSEKMRLLGSFCVCRDF